MIAVAVAGAAGRMGETVCAAVQGAEDMELVGRADPLLDTALADVLENAATGLVGERRRPGRGPVAPRGTVNRSRRIANACPPTVTPLVE